MKKRRKEEKKKKGGRWGVPLINRGTVLYCTVLYCINIEIAFLRVLEASKKK